MARTYRSGYPRQCWDTAEWERTADGGSDTKVKAEHVAQTKAAERQAVRTALRRGLEPAPTKWVRWHILPPAPRPIPVD